MDNRSYSIGPLTGYAKPKYRVVTNILGDTFNPEHGLDVFIDLNTLLSTLSTSKKFLNSLPFAKNVEQDIISSILMIQKHWKDYTRKWDDVRIFLIVNDTETTPICEQKVLQSYLIPYVNKFKNDRLTQLNYYWNESIRRIEIILNYIPKSYLIKTDRFDSFVIPNLLDDYKKRRRLIISSNPLMTNYCYMKNTNMIYPRYRYNGMLQLSDPLMIVQSITKIDDDIMKAFIQNKVFYNILSAIVGDFDRGIIGLTQIGMSCFATNLLRAVEQGEIPESPKNIKTVLPAIDKVFHDYLIKTYPLVDIQSHTDLIPASQIEKIKAKMVDLYDIDGLNKLSINGLNLMELL